MKAKIFRFLIKYIAGFVILLSCNISLAEFIEGENPNSFYILKYKKISSNSADSKNIAKSKSELLAIREFINFAVSENLIIPRNLTYVSDKIKATFISTKSKGTLKGVKTLKSLILKDKRAVCVLEIPKENIKNFESLDFRNNPKEILKHLNSNKLLKLEIQLVLGLDDISNIINNNSVLYRSIKKESLLTIPQLWISDIALDKNTISKITDNDLIFVLEMAFGQTKIDKLIIAEMKRRGFEKSAEFVSLQKLQTIAIDEKFNKVWASIKTENINSNLIKVLSSHKSAISFINSSEENKKYNEASSEFSKENPDFKKIRKLILDSFLINISDNAMNLLGRAYEEESSYTEAIVIYLQALCINQNQPYSKFNLANCFYKNGMIDNAKYWTEETLKDTTSAKWSKNSAKELQNKLNYKNENKNI